MDQDGPSGGGGWFQETALSFTGIVTIFTLCCCTTISCVALCIKLASWMFGHRGRRRRILLLPPDERHYHRQFNDGEEEDGYPRSPRPIIIVGENSARQGNVCGVHPTEIELREVPFGNIEEQRRTPKTGQDGDAVFGKGASNREGDERLNGSGIGLKRDTTSASMMTRTGTPSVNGEHRGISPSSSHGSQDLGDHDDGGGGGGGGDGHGGGEEDEGERKGRGPGEEDAERGMGE